MASRQNILQDAKGGAHSGRPGADNLRQMETIGRGGPVIENREAAGPPLIEQLTTGYEGGQEATPIADMTAGLNRKNPAGTVNHGLSLSAFLFSVVYERLAAYHGGLPTD